MTNLKIETHVQQFAAAVNRVLDTGRNVLSNDRSDTSLAAIAFERDALSQLRNDLAKPSRDLLGHRVIEHDYQALVKFLAPYSVPSEVPSIGVSESGRITAITQMNISRSSLAPIELLSELRSLTLFGNVLDCSLLSELPCLKSLIMNQNTTLDVGTLGAMFAVERIDCDQSLVGDLSWVLSCPNLKELSVASCKLYSIEALSGCRALEVLDVSNNPLHSLAPIGRHQHIKELRIHGTQITEFSPLTSLPSLSALRVSEDMTVGPAFAKCLRYLHQKGVKVARVNADFSVDYI